MKLNPDDPKLTAYALGELSEEERAAVAKAVGESREAQEWVAEVRALAATVRAEFAADLEERKPLNIMPLPGPRSFWSDNRFASISLAALLAVFAIIAAALFGPASRERSSLARGRFAKAPADVQIEFESDTFEADLDFGAGRGEPGDRFLSAADKPFSTFSVVVGKASYLDLQRAIEGGALPPRPSVKVEEMINYFTYDDPEPEGDQPISINAEVAGCPWRPEHRLVRIAVQTRRALDAETSSRRATVAEDVTAQVEFNPTRVAFYRLIGFDQPRHGDRGQDVGASSDIRAGDAVTVLYEVVPARGASGPAETVVVRASYNRPAGDGQLLEYALTDSGEELAAASVDFKFAAAVAEFGMLLRDSSVQSRQTLGSIAELANQGRGSDRDGRRAGFVELVRKAELLTGG